MIYLSNSSRSIGPDTDSRGFFEYLKFDIGVSGKNHRTCEYVIIVKRVYCLIMG